MSHPVVALAKAIGNKQLAVLAKIVEVKVSSPVKIGVSILVEVISVRHGGTTP